MKLTDEENARLEELVGLMRKALFSAAPCMALINTSSLALILGAMEELKALRAQNGGAVAPE